MARVAVPKGAWVSLGTTSVNTLIGVEGGSVRLATGSTTGLAFDAGVEIKAGDSIVVPSGLAISVQTDQDGVSVTEIDFG